MLVCHNAKEHGSFHFFLKAFCDSLQMKIFVVNRTQNFTECYRITRKAAVFEKRLVIIFFLSRRRELKSQQTANSLSLWRLSRSQTELDDLCPAASEKPN